MSDIKLVNCHSHSTYSCYDSIGYPEDYIDYILETNGDGIAITDHGNMNSFSHAYLYTEKLNKKGINFKYVPGLEAYFLPSISDWKKLYDENKIIKKQKMIAEELTYEIEEDAKLQKDELNKRNHLTLLAKSSQGLESLFKLVSLSYKKGFYRYPRIDFDMLEKYGQDVICLSGCVAGPFSAIIDSNNKSFETIQLELEALTDKFVSIFKDNFFYEIQFNKLEQQQLLNKHLISLSKKTGIKLIATNDAHYYRPELWKERELYRKLSPKFASFSKDKALPENISELECELYPKNGNETFAAYQKYCSTIDKDIALSAIENSWYLVHEHIGAINADRTIKLPSFVSNKSEIEQLTELCSIGLKAKNLHTNEEYLSRLKHELDVIHEKKFERYFLTLHKAIKALSAEILVGPGRGSGAGSLVNFLLDITQVDPIKANLLFSRFISLARFQYPDVDLDFEDKDKATEILKRTFGEENVIAVATYNKLQIKSLVKDISKFFDIPFQEVNLVTKAMESEVRKKILKRGDDKNLFELTWENSTEHSETFKAFIEKYPDVGKHIKVLFQQVRSIGKHAGAIIIAENLENKMPLIINKGAQLSPITEGVTVKHLEEFGFLKFDCLALKTLRIIRTCIEKILQNQNKDTTFNSVKSFYNEHLHPYYADLSDERVFKNTFWKGRFPAIFQFTEKYTQKFAKSFKPLSIDDISSITSIYRPGPLASNVDKKFLKIRNGEEKVSYKHDALKEVLGATSGQLIYQEQLMLTAEKLCGFSPEECDTLRKVILKRVFATKDESFEKREKLKTKFIDGAIDNGMSESDATELFKEFEYAAGYLFNKSHSWSYSLISYQCAWLFTYYEKEWLQAFLEHKEDNPDKKENAISEIKSYKYKFIKPDINNASKEWVIDKGNITFSLTSLKGIGAKSVEKILGNQPYENIDDLLFNEKALNKKELECLSKISALDSLNIIGKDKMFKTYKHFYDVVVENLNKIKHKKKGKEYLNELLEQISPSDWTAEDKIKHSIDITGTIDVNSIISAEVLSKIKENRINSISNFNGHTQDIVWFLIKDISLKQTKTNKKYAIINVLSDIGTEHRIWQWGYFKNEFYKPYNVYAAKVNSDPEWGFSIRTLSDVIQLNNN